MPLALTGNELGLAGVAFAFIAFALASSFLFPRRNADFPGRRVGLYTVLVIAFMIAMLGAVWFLAEEGEEAEAGAQTEQVVETGAGETTSETETTGGAETAGGAETETASGETGEAVEGDPEAGKQVFASAACDGCHTLADAGSSGNVGPNLDEAQPSFEEAVTTVTNGRGVMPAFGDQLSEEEIRNVAAYVSSVAGG